MCIPRTRILSPSPPAPEPARPPLTLTRTLPHLSGVRMEREARGRVGPAPGARFPAGRGLAGQLESHGRHPRGLSRERLGLPLEGGAGRGMAESDKVNPLLVERNKDGSLSFSSRHSFLVVHEWHEMRRAHLCILLSGVHVLLRRYTVSLPPRGRRGGCTFLHFRVDELWVLAPRWEAIRVGHVLAVVAVAVVALVSVRQSTAMSKRWGNQPEGTFALSSMLSTFLAS